MCPTGQVIFSLGMYLFSQQCTWPLQFTGLVQILAGHMKIFAGHVNLQNHVPDGNVNQMLNVKPWTVVNSEWLNGQGMDSESYWTHWPLNDAVVILNWGFATNHFLSQCWPWSISTYSVTRPQWVYYMYHHYCLLMPWLLVSCVCWSRSMSPYSITRTMS